MESGNMLLVVLRLFVRVGLLVYGASLALAFLGVSLSEYYKLFSDGVIGGIFGVLIVIHVLGEFGVKKAREIV